MEKEAPEVSRGLRARTPGFLSWVSPGPRIHVVLPLDGFQKAILGAPDSPSAKGG